MANRNLCLILGVAVVSMGALYLFTSNLHTARSQLQEELTAMPRAEQPSAQTKLKSAKKAMKKARRKAFLEKWNAMTPEQQAEYRKTHPKAKLPPEIVIPGKQP